MCIRDSRIYRDTLLRRTSSFGHGGLVQASAMDGYSRYTYRLLEELVNQLADQGEVTDEELQAAITTYLTNNPPVVNAGVPTDGSVGTDQLAASLLRTIRNTFQSITWTRGDRDIVFTRDSGSDTITYTVPGITVEDDGTTEGSANLVTTINFGTGLDVTPSGGGTGVTVAAADSGAGALAGRISSLEEFEAALRTTTVHSNNTRIVVSSPNQAYSLGNSIKIPADTADAEITISITGTGVDPASETFELSELWGKTAIVRANTAMNAANSLSVDSRYWIGIDSSGDLFFGAVAIGTRLVSVSTSVITQADPGIKGITVEDDGTASSSTPITTINFAAGLDVSASGNEATITNAETTKVDSLSDEVEDLMAFEGALRTSSTIQATTAINITTLNRSYRLGTLIEDVNTAKAATEYTSTISEGGAETTQHTFFATELASKAFITQGTNLNDTNSISWFHAGNDITYRIARTSSHAWYFEAEGAGAAGGGIYSQSVVKHEIDTTAFGHPLANVPDASLTQKGVVQLARQQELNLGGDATKATTPNIVHNFVNAQIAAIVDPDATTEVKGKVELSTFDEVSEGTDTTKAVTPKITHDYVQREINDNLGIVVNATFALTFTAVGGDRDYGGTGNTGTQDFEVDGKDFRIRRALSDSDDTKFILKISKITNPGATLGVLSDDDKATLSEVTVEVGDSRFQFHNVYFSTDATSFSEYEWNWPTATNPVALGANNFKLYEKLDEDALLADKLPTGGTPGQYVTPAAGGAREWKDLPSSFSPNVVRLHTGRE